MIDDQYGGSIRRDDDQKHDGGDRGRRRRDEENDAAVCGLLNIIICQNEMILCLLEKRASKLSPEDQAKVDAIFAIERRDQRKIDAALVDK